MRLIPQAWTTERLHIRRFTPADASFVLELHANPDLARFVPSAVMTTPAEALAWVERSVAGPGRGWWLVELLDGTPVAAILLKEAPASAGVDLVDVEIGWRQHAEHTGNGYVTEAARTVLGSALASGLSRVVAVVDPDNLASQRVAVRIGMTGVGIRGDYYDTDLEVYEATA